MKWKTSVEGTYHLSKRFAWFPTTIKGGTTIWLESYWELTKLFVTCSGGAAWLSEKVYLESDKVSHRACQKLANGNTSTSWW